MTSAQPPKSAGWFSGRTRLITIVSIVAVALAGATAVSANIGILDSASDSPVGNASITGDLATPSTQVIDVYLPNSTAAVEQSTTTTPTSPTTDPVKVQEFEVDVAGTVAVAATDAGLRIDHVTPAAGWSWSLSQSDPSTVMVTMTDGARTFEFIATKTADGTVAASVSEPIETPAPATTAGSYNDENDDHDDHEEHEEDEYEGGDDDD